MSPVNDGLGTDFSPAAMLQAPDSACWLTSQSAAEA